MERKLGEKLRLTSHKHPFLKTVNECVYDIPLISSLKQLLSDEFIFDEVCDIFDVLFLNNWLRFSKDIQEMMVYLVIIVMVKVLLCILSFHVNHMHYN